MVAPAHAQGDLCGDLSNAYGPYDYRRDRGDTLGRVEAYHFTSSVEHLIRGKSATLGGDIDYTLRAFPNHHRALISMHKLGDRLKTDQVSGANYTVECYFQRALRFRPDDTTARMLYASFLHQKRRKEEALVQMRVVATHAAESPFTLYNMGLVYFDMDEPALALEKAHAAMAGGFPRTDLKDKLVAAGRWTDPVPPVAAAASSAEGSR